MQHFPLRGNADKKLGSPGGSELPSGASGRSPCAAASKPGSHSRFSQKTISLEENNFTKNNGLFANFEREWLNNMRYGWIIFLAFFGFFYHSTSVAANQQGQLNQLIEKIKTVQKSLSTKNSQRNALQNELKKIETKYGSTAENLRQTEEQIFKQKLQIAALENDALLHQDQMKAQQKALATQLRLSYLLKRQGAIKLLLSQQNTNDLNRLLYYYRSLNEYRLKNIAQLQTELESIYRHQQALYTQYQILRQLQEKQQKERQQLAIVKINRTNLIKKINQTIHNQKQQLSHLASDKKRLEDTVTNLSRRQKTNSNTRYLQHTRFAQLKGHLPWPTKGQVLHYFGKPIQKSQIKWTGELIKAADEQPVHAVADGTIVFSKWLEGYGLLVIIDHGNHYMTLYGRNHNLYKHVGDQVSAGDLIATVGQSGGYDQTALYFAIRYNAKPLDPNRWCT